MLRAIHEVLDADEEPMVKVPCDALLRRLPPNLRGPAWKADAFPSVTLDLTVSSVMAQLAKGRLAYPLSEFIVDIPEGWIGAQAKPETEVELDLSRVVQAMPKDSFKPKSKTSAVTPELNQIRDFFAPGAAVAQPLEAAGTPAPAAHEPAKPSSPGGAAAVPAKPAVPPVAVSPAAGTPKAPPPAAGKPEAPVFAARPAVQEPVKPSGPGAAAAVPAKPAVPPVAVSPAAGTPKAPPPAAGKPEAPVFAAKPAVQEPVKPSGPGAAAAVPAKPAVPPVAVQAPVPPAKREARDADEEPMVRIPCDALLRGLPQELRGPAWNAETYPPAALELSQSSVLGQLAKGRLMYPLSMFIADVPEGWLSADAKPDTLVELDLARVVQAMPRDRFAPRDQTQAVSEDMARMRDFFVPQAAGVHPQPSAPAAPPLIGKPSPPEPAAPLAKAPALAPVPPPLSPTVRPPEHRPELKPSAGAEPPAPAVAKPAAPPRRAATVAAWDGRDLRPDAGPNVVDLNRASVEDLARLPGVGAHLAETILAHRQEHGRFAGIFDLAEVEGIGPKTFTMITGLSLETRQDRHEILNALLGMAPEARPSLTELAQAVNARLATAGVVMSSLDGMLLAQGGTVADRAGLYAAIVPQMFRRTRRYFRQLVDSRVQAMAIPLIRPPLLLVDANALFIVVVLAEGQDFDATSRQAMELARELHWLLDYRAVVGA